MSCRRAALCKALRALSYKRSSPVRILDGLHRPTPYIRGKEGCHARRLAAAPRCARVSGSIVIYPPPFAAPHLSLWKLTAKNPLTREFTLSELSRSVLAETLKRRAHIIEASHHFQQAGNTEYLFQATCEAEEFQFPAFICAHPTAHQKADSLAVNEIHFRTVEQDA